MHGLIAAAGLSSRLQDLGDKRNKVLLDLGGQTLLGNILNVFGAADVSDILVVAGFDGLAVRLACNTKATCLFNPFFEHYGILSSVWQASDRLAGKPFVFTTGDHYFTADRLRAFLADQPEADTLVDVELKACDDEDMKVYVTRTGEFRTMSKTILPGTILGEFTGLVRFSADGSQHFFDTLDKHVWHKGIQGFVADVLCAGHRKWELAFHLSTDHCRVDVDFPYDLARAQELFSQSGQDKSLTG